MFSTFIAFAIFVALTGFDTRRGQRNEWYPPVALLANSYILALLLIVVWMTPAGWSLVWDIFWKSLVVLIATRAVVGCAQLLLNMADKRPRPLGVFALITSLLATVTGILFTAPIAIPDGPVQMRMEVDEERLYFAFRVGDGDWRWMPDHFDASIASDEAAAPGTPNFTGAFVGMCCQDMAGTRRHADFDYFEYREREYVVDPRTR